MIGLLGVLRWALRPLDKLWLTSAALAGTALTAPVLVMRSFRFGRARTMTTLGMWEACICVPFFGRYAFAGMVHFAAPYTGSVNPMLTVMKDKYAEGFIIERPWLHNPFNSVHAVAMTNLGEFVSGILVTSQMEVVSLSGPTQIRGIVTGLSTEYHKKVVSELFDTSNTKVATTTAKWTVDVRDRKHK
eukprot:gene7563-9841_t